MKLLKQGKSGAQSGFSLVELMLVLLVLTIVMGVVFNDINSVQKRYRTEESKLDLTQESREFLDQIVRDMHQAGYPGTKQYAVNVLGGTPDNDSRNAVGLVSVSSTDLWFEGDIDGDGQVDSVRYTLQATGGNCPCTVRRSQVIKVNGVAPLAQTVTYSVEVQNVINSGGLYPIAGTSRFGGAPVSNDTLYSEYKSAALFTAYNNSGAVVTLPVDISTNRTLLKTIKTIRINLNVLSPNTDLQTGLRPAVAMTATARLNN